MNVVAGIVTYNPDIEILRKCIKSTWNQVEKIFIIDNASDNQFIISTLTQEYHNVELIINEENLGIAKALNQIVRAAIKENYDWVLLLDQDTVLSDKYIQNMMGYQHLTEIAIITPKITDRDNLLGYDESYESEEYVSRCITSGSVNRVSSWKLVNGFDENMFIDGVDHDYCFRIINSGYKILKTNKVEIEHKIGNSQEFNFFGAKIRYLNHNPIRKYYILKNIFYFDKKNRSIGLSTWLRAIKQYLLVLAFEKNKLEKFSYMSKGVRDGIKS